MTSPFAGRNGAVHSVIKSQSFPCGFIMTLMYLFALQTANGLIFVESLIAGLAQLRDYLAWLDSPEGVLQSL